MKTIPLTQNKFALVDDEDYDWLMQWKWNCDSRGYARRLGPTDKVTKKRQAILMHREIYKTPDGFMTDHIDHNRINNQKYNLRIATTSQNQMNRKINVGKKSSQYKGVSRHKSSNKWRSQIKINGKKKWLGDFSTEKEAAKAYNTAAFELHGEFLLLSKEQQSLSSGGLS